MGDTILTMSNISKRFSGVKVLDQVDFSLKKGEIHVLIGENGAGKSTLMKILTGVYQKDEGKILLENNSGNLEEVVFKTPKQALDCGISMVFQEFNLIENMSIAENIYIGREPIKNFKVDFKKMQRDALEELKKVQLNVSPRTLVSSLTVAEKQVVEIAKCISFNARVIILDEPTSALSEKEVDALFKLVKMLKKQGISIIYISHRMEEIFEIGDRITVLRDGQFINTVKVSETTPNEIVKMMIGRDFDEQDISREHVIRDEVMLECRNISVRKDGEKFDFKVYKGEILGIFGLIGAGRTELAKRIFGLDNINDGEIYKKGKKITIRNPWDAIDHKIGLIPEDRKIQGLNLKQDIRDNITLIKLRDLGSILMSKNNENEITKKYMDLLSVVASSPFQTVERLSGGNQQKVAIGKWLSIDLDVIIMDEPTRGIDVGAKAEIYKLMRYLAQEGKSIIVISSDLPEVLRVSDRIVVMHDGKIKFDEPNLDLNQEIIMQAALR